jgi:hypothetical protein
VTANASDARLDGLTASLAEVVCWTIFYLERAADTDAEVAAELVEMIGARLRDMAVADRVRFLEHAATRATTSMTPAFQDFLLELAEKLGLE